MCMLEKRLQILLDAEQHRRVAAVARSRGVSVARVIREAIDAYIPNDDDARRAAAAKHILSAEPMDLPDVEELKREIDKMWSGGS